MINVIDEVPNTSATDGVIKYRIIHEDNTSEVVQMGLETPIDEQGTPYNRALGESIKNHLDLISRYWGFVGAEQGNYINPNLTNDNKQGYTISTAGTGSVTIPTNKTIYDVFNSTNTSRFKFTFSSSTKNVMLNITAPLEIKLNNLKIVSPYGIVGNIRCIVQGSDDNSTWTTLVDKYFGAGSTETITMTNSTQSYTYFKINFRNDDNIERVMTFFNMQLQGYIVTDNSTENPLPEFIGSIEEGQRLYVKTIQGYVMYNDVDYNINLDGQLYPLPKTLSANTKYVLVYDGEKFVTEANY